MDSNPRINGAIHTLIQFAIPVGVILFQIIPHCISDIVQDVVLDGKYDPDLL